jgi:nitrogen regulatory protein PII
MNKHKLIVTIVKKGKATKILQSAKKVGVQTGTVLLGKGTAKKNIYESILGMEVEPEKEIILIAIDESLVEDVLNNITKTGNLNKPGEGIAFVLDLNSCIGISKLLSI